MSGFNTNALVKRIDEHWCEFLEFIQESDKTTVADQEDFACLRVSDVAKKKLDRYVNAEASSEQKRAYMRYKPTEEVIPGDIMFFPVDLDDLSIAKQRARRDVEVYLSERLSKYKQLSMIQVLAYVDQKIKLMAKGYDITEDDKVRHLFETLTEADDESLQIVERLVDTQDLLTEYLSLFDKYRQFEYILPQLEGIQTVETLVSEFKNPQCTNLKQLINEDENDEESESVHHDSK